MLSLKPNTKHSKSVNIMQFWGGTPETANSKWRRTLRLVERCSEFGWKSSIVFSELPTNKDLLMPFIDTGAEILVHKRLSGHINIPEILDTYKFLRKHSCDILHCHNRPVVPLICAFLLRFPGRIWSRLAMSSFYEENIKPRGLQLFQPNIRISCLFSNRILCISKPVMEELTNISRKIESKTIISGAGFDLNLYANGSPESIRDEFSLSGSSPIIVTVGHAVQVKGWDILIHAYSKFHRLFPQSKLLMVGSTESEHEKETINDVIQLIKNYSLEKNVIITGRREDIPNILSVADIYIQPSRSEGLCGALIEALSSSSPCIASKAGGITDVIKDGYNGLLFEREDVNQLFDHMVNICNDPMLKEHLSKNALPSVKKYSIERVTDEIIHEYLSLLSKLGYLSY